MYGGHNKYMYILVDLHILYASNSYRCYSLVSGT